MGAVVVVGASLAGLRVVEQLRRLGHEGPVTVVGEELHAPYDRPPLSKQVLRGAEPSSVLLRDPAALDALGAEFLLGRRATGLDLAARRLLLDDGRRLPFDDAVVATGVEARRLPFGHDLSGVHTLRTLDDAAAVRDALPGARRAVVVGGGFIGCEVAASLCQIGLEVTLVEGAPAPLAAALGEQAGALVADLHRRQGVDVRCGTGVAGLEGVGSVEGVRLMDGALLPADLVVVGIGGRPATDWLQGCGLVLDDGVVCDEHGQAAAGVWAAGDVARWYHPRFAAHLRVEHWTTAVEHAGVVARNILAVEPEERVPYAGVPYFWSDQYDTRIQFAGHRLPGEQIVLSEEAPGQHVGLIERDGAPVGALAINAPRQLLRLRALIAKGAPVQEPLPVPERVLP